MAEPKTETAGEKPVLDDLAIAALQAQIADLREMIGALEAKLERLTSGDERVAVVEKCVTILAAIVGELHTNAARSDIAPLAKQLKALVAPFLKENVRAAA